MTKEANNTDYESPDLDTAFFPTLEDVNNPLPRFRFDGSEETQDGETMRTVMYFTADFKSYERDC